MSESTAMDAALAVALAAPLAGAPTGASESTAASPVPAGGKKNQKTDQDQKNAQFFMTILSNMTNRPKVDWDVVAKEAGYSNADSAKVRYGQIRKKLGLAPPAAAAPKTPKTPSKPRAKKEKAVGSGTNASASKVAKTPRTPSKKSKAAKAAEEKAAEENPEGEKAEDDNEEKMVNPFEQDDGNMQNMFQET